MKFKKHKSSDVLLVENFSNLIDKIINGDIIIYKCCYKYIWDGDYNYTFSIDDDITCIIRGNEGNGLISLHINEIPFPITHEKIIELYEFILVYYQNKKITENIKLCYNKYEDFIKDLINGDINITSSYISLESNRYEFTVNNIIVTIHEGHCDELISLVIDGIELPITSEEVVKLYKFMMNYKNKKIEENKNKKIEENKNKCHYKYKDFIKDLISNRKYDETIKEFQIQNINNMKKAYDDFLKTDAWTICECSDPYDILKRLYDNMINSITLK